MRYRDIHTIFYFEAFAMMNLHYEIRICQKIYNRVTTHNKSKCLVQNSLHQTLFWCSTWNLDLEQALKDRILSVKLRYTSKFFPYWYSASGCPLASRNKSRGLDPTGTMPLSSVGTSSTPANNTASSITGVWGVL